MVTMTQKNIIQIFRPPAYHEATHISSNQKHWMNQYNGLCETLKQHRRSLKTLNDDNDKYCKPMVGSKHNTPVPRGLYMMIQNDIKDVLDRRKDDMRKFLDAHKAVSDIRNALKENIQKEMPSDGKLEKIYEHTRNELDKHSAVVDKCKKSYHKVVFKIEKARISSTLATKPNTVYKTDKRVRSLTDRSKVALDIYQDAVIEWRQEATHLSEIATELKEEFIEREGKRANMIIGSLGVCCNNDRTGLKSNNDSDMPFRGIDGRELITEVVNGMIETLVIPVLEPYIHGQTDITYDTAKSGLPVNDDSDIDEGDSDLEDIEDTEFRKEIETNRKLKRLRKSQVFIVTESYKKKIFSEISLKVGERVKQLLPANADGYAYGTVTHGKMRKKKKGFYPDSHVALIDLLESDDEDSDEDNVKKHRKKIVKKVVARAKAKHVEDDIDDRFDNGPVVAIDDVFEMCFSDVDDDDETASANAKAKKKSKLKSLVKAVKPKKKKKSEESQVCDRDIIVEFEEDIENVDDILTLYKKKTKTEKVRNSLFGPRQSKSEHVKKDGSENDATDRKHKKKNKLMKTLKALKGGRHEESVPSCSKTVVRGFDEEFEIGDSQTEEAPKKKSKGLSKLKKIFKRSKKDRSNAEEESDSTSIDFQFIKSQPEMLKGARSDVSETEVMHIDIDDEDFGYVRLME